MKSLLESENLPLFSGSHEISCHVCKGKGVLICCDFCPYAYHPSCLQPPMIQRPLGYWVCPVCQEDIKRQHKSDIKLRCEKHKDTIPSVNAFLQSSSPTPVSIQSFMPTRISSARFPVSTFTSTPSLSKSKSKSQSQSQSQFQFQSQSHSHSHSQSVFCHSFYMIEFASTTRNERHFRAISVECTTAAQSGTPRSRFEGKKSWGWSHRIMSSIWALLIQSGKQPSAMIGLLRSIMENEPCSISLGEMPSHHYFLKNRLAFL